MSSFESMNVRQLRQYLKEKGQNQSGVKEELIKRAQATEELLKTIGTVSLPTSSSNAADFEKLTSLQAKHTFVCSLKSWVEVDAVPMDEWPQISEKELYNFLLYSRGAKKQVKAKNFYDCKHVHSIQYHCVNSKSTECYITSKVIPSAALADTKKAPDYSAWVQLSKITAYVNAGYCTCPAGLEGACNHVAALLYALIDITDAKSKGLDAATSSKCKWKTPRKRKLSPQKAASLMPTTNKGLKAKKIPTPTDDASVFINRLKAVLPQAGIVVNMTAVECDHPTLPPFPKPLFCFKDSIDLTTQMCQDAFRNLVESFDHVTSETITQIEALTRGQSKNILWKEARKGCITSSLFGKIVKRNRTIFPSSILKSVLGYESDFVTWHTEWGINKEKQALCEYVSQHSHPDIQVCEAGLMLNSKVPYLAASPDGLISCSGCSPSSGLIEIKCPSVFRNSKPEEACLNAQFCCKLQDGAVTLKRDHIYYYQVQGQMGVTGRKWCDFVVWTLKGLSVERIYFDESLWVSIKSELVDFFKQYVVPEMFSCRLLRKKSD